MDASKIHYVLTNKDSKDAIVEGVLSSADNGLVGNRYVNSDYRGIRPVFNLESSVTYASGDVTMSNPIRFGD